MTTRFVHLLRISVCIALSLVIQQTALAVSIKVPLQKFTAKSSLEMRCLNGGERLSIPIPERWKVTKATLSLHYTVSNNMLPDLSQMAVKLNDDLLTQLKLNNQEPGQVSEIQIPPEALKPGYNTFKFQTAQHYSRNQCEQPCAPDLWTNISMADSFIQLDYETKPVPLKLGEATKWIFDPKQFPEASVNLVADTSTADSVTMVGVAASGIARRFDYRKVKFSHTDFIKSGMDNVLIGTSDFVGKVLADYGISLEAMDGGLIKIFPLPKLGGGTDDQHVLILVTGNQLKTLKIAAETFANMSLPYPGTDVLHAYGFSMPDISMYSGREELVSGKTYDFNTLGMSTYLYQGYNNATDISFRLPPDFLIKQNQYAKVVLNFSYGAGLRSDSSLSVVLNDKPVRDIHLDNVAGNYIDGYHIDLPTYLFKAGRNTISFKPYFNTARQVCDAANTNGLFVTLFGTSTLMFPPMPHFVEMPRMDLFALNGFPFTRWPDGYETLVYLPKHDSASIDTALDMIGLITQRNGFPLFGTKIVFDEPKGWTGEMLVVGEANSIPKSIMSLAPLQPDGTGKIPYPVVRGWDTDTSIAESQQKSGLGEGTGLLMEFESGVKKGRSIVLATAQTSKDLLTLGDALLSPSVLAAIEGDVSLIQLNVPDYDVKSISVGRKYSTGDKGKISYIDSFLYSYPYVLYGLIGLTVFLLMWIIYKMLRRRYNKRNGGGQGQA